MLFRENETRDEKQAYLAIQYLQLPPSVVSCSKCGKDLDVYWEDPTFYARCDSCDWLGELCFKSMELLRSAN